MHTEVFRAREASMQQLMYIYERKMGGKANVTNANNWGTGMKIYTHMIIFIYLLYVFKLFVLFLQLFHMPEIISK